MGLIIISTTVGVIVGYLIGRRRERVAGEQRLRLARRYWRSEAGASAVVVSLGLIAIGAAYVGGHVLVWALR